MTVVDQSAILSRSRKEPTTDAVNTLTRDFLTWLAGGTRSYAEAMEAWRTSCPRFPIWENAVDGGLIHLESRAGSRMRETVVVLTPRGRAVLAGQ